VALKLESLSSPTWLGQQPAMGATNSVRCCRDSSELPPTVEEVQAVRTDKVPDEPDEELIELPPVLEQVPEEAPLEMVQVRALPGEDKLTVVHIEDSTDDEDDDDSCMDSQEVTAIRTFKSDRGHSCASDRRFPVFCLPMNRFMELERMQKHEAVYSKLVTPADSMMMHFVSHEWLGFDHPDPDGVQLSLVQRVLAKFSAGHAKSFFSEADWQGFLQGFSSGTGEVVRRAEALLIERDVFTEADVPLHIAKGCVWLDYHSIPQDRTKPEFVAAVNSIPHYVERCDYFWVCAPNAQHGDLNESRDFFTWKQRGWCRLEEMTNLLSKNLKMPLVITNDKRVETYGFLEWVQTMYFRPERSVANGTFTCCRFGHRVQVADGSYRHIDCDKKVITPVMSRVFSSLFDHAKGDGDWFKRNLLRGAAHGLFAGFEEFDPSLRCWAIPMEESLDAFLSRAGFEDVDALDKLGWPCLMWAFHYANMDVIHEIMDRRPEMLYVRPMQGQSILSVAVHRPIADFKEIVLKDPRTRCTEELNHASKRGYTPLDRAAKFGHHDVVRYLLELGANTEVKRLDNGCTPLLSAADVGFPLCIQALIDFGADINARSSTGQTALHLAARQVHVTGNIDTGAKVACISILIKAGSDLKARDDCGRTPLEVAEHCGWPEGVLALGFLEELEV